MKELLVISGKGGTGKTTIVGSLAVLAANKVLADCDVDAADLHLLLEPQPVAATEFSASKQAVIHPQQCSGCGICLDVCRFDAIKEIGGRLAVDEIDCEGCGVCFHACPERAIAMEDKLSGHWFISQTPYGALVHARLGIAEDNSGKLVALVRRQARILAEEQRAEYIITDGPPGIGCPVIAALSGVDLALIITEPSVAGKHDLERILQLTRHFGVKPLVCINKYDLHPGYTEEIQQYCRREQVDIVGLIPFDETVVAALVQGVPIVAYEDRNGTREAGSAASAIKEMWTAIESLLTPALSSGS
ncbi:MAG: 4Fe-4S binding protein [Firmicutes bacterium]|nr:4Fe-4S binding protein [Bacillota bacterium]